MSAAEALDFLQLLYGAPDQGHLVIWTSKDHKSHWFNAADLEAAADRAARLAGDGDVYFGTGLQRAVLGAGKRGTAASVIALPGLWLDLDVHGEAHKADNLPPDRAAAVAFLADFPMAPTTVVDSGHGLQAWWLFRDLWRFADEAERQEAERLSARFQSTLIGLGQERGWHVDATMDLARVLRLPGTVNRKLEPVPVRVVEVDPARRYAVEDFEPHLRAATGLAIKTVSKTNVSRTVAITEQHRNVTLTSLAGTMRRRGMTGEAIKAALLAENLRRCSPPLSDAEVVRIAASVAGYNPADDETVRYTDVGNARRLIAEHGSEFRYVPQWGEWLTWDGQRWRADTRGTIVERAKAIARSLWEEAAGLPVGSEERKLAGRWALQSESAPRIEAMVKMARTVAGIPVDPDDLDADAWVLNVANGVIDLRTGRLLSHDPRRLITKLAPVAFDGGAEAPRWHQFLEQVLPDEEVRKFISRWAGYCLTGSVQEHKVVFAFGSGANGKSTMTTALAGVLGDYACQAAPDLLMRRREDPHPTGLADLHGARLVLATETAQGRHLDEQLLKRLTGGDRIKARKLYRDFFEFAPTHKFIVATNHRPGVEGTDLGIWRRLRLVPFTVTIPDVEQDHRLDDRLAAEAPGILRWALEGCLQWQAGSLTEPAAVLAATADYRADMDPLGDFISDNCLLANCVSAKASDLYAAYMRWAESMGERPISQRRLGLRLRERGLAKRTNNGVWWDGIGLRTEPCDQQGSVVKSAGQEAF